MTPRENDLKEAHQKLLQRRNTAIETINLMKARKEEVQLEISEVEENLAVAVSRFNDPEQDMQLAAAHREVARLKCDCETLKYERDMGYLFVKNDESEVIFLNDQIKELEAKEVRKRKKIKNVGFERAAAREEYKNWLDVGGANEIATAAMILTNAIEVKNKYEDLRVSAKALEQAQEQE